MKKYPDGHFELVVVEVTAEDGAFNDAVKGPYQLLNALWNTYIRYIDRQHHRQQHVIHPTLNSFIARFILTSSSILSGRGIPDGMSAWM